MSEIKNNENTIGGETKPDFVGKIAVATNDKMRVSGHIGRCKIFMVYEIDKEEIVSKEVRENNFKNHRGMYQNHQHHVEGEGHNHFRLIEILKDCSYLISSGGGWRVVEDLKQNNINTIFTNENLIERAVNKFFNGKLMNEAELTCSHNE